MKIDWKVRMYNTSFRPILIYGIETRTDAAGTQQNTHSRDENIKSDRWKREIGRKRR